MQHTNGSSAVNSMTSMLGVFALVWYGMIRRWETGRSWTDRKDWNFLAGASVRNAQEWRIWEIGQPRRDDMESRVGATAMRI